MKWNTLSESFDDWHPLDILRWVAEATPNHCIGLGTGFGRGGLCLIDMLVRINKEIPIFYLDTGFLFTETYALRDQLEEKYGIKLVRYAADLTPEQQTERHGEALWETNPNLCCRIRKVDPLVAALNHYDVWITAIRREQSTTRIDTGIIEWDPKYDVLKINPLANWTRGDVDRYISENQVPYNPLHDQGYPSIGCTHCTSQIAEGENEREGRWRGRSKTECGLHIQTG